MRGLAVEGETRGTAGFAPQATGVAATIAQTRTRVAASCGAARAGYAAAYNGGAGAVRGPGQYRNAEYPAKVLQVMGGRWPVRGA